MPRRLALGCCLAVALLAAPLTAESRADGGRVVVGRTAQGEPVQIAMEGEFIRFLRFRANLDCRDGSLLTVEEHGFLRTRLRRGRRFRDEQIGSTDVVDMVGRVTPEGGVRGRIRVRDQVRGGVRCTSNWLGFSAGG